MAKKANKRPTRKQCSPDHAPPLFTCSRCGFKGTKYQVKTHKELCNG
jgi:hypothetical protein